MRYLSMIMVLPALAMAGPAIAATTSLNFAGTFDVYRSGCSPYSPPPGNVCTTSPIATPFSGSFLYDTGAGGLISDVVVSSAAFTSIGRDTTLLGTGPANRASSNGANSLVFGNLLGSTYNYNLAGLTLLFPAGTIVDPASPPALSTVTGGTFAFYSGGSPGGSGPSLSGFITSVNVAAVPEPATWAMMMLGVGVVGYSLRRRQKVTTRVRFA